MATVDVEEMDRATILTNVSTIKGLSHSNFYSIFKINNNSTVIIPTTTKVTDMKWLTETEIVMEMDVVDNTEVVGMIAINTTTMDEIITKISIKTTHRVTSSLTTIILVLTTTKIKIIIKINSTNNSKIMATTTLINSHINHPVTSSMTSPGTHTLQRRYIPHNNQ